MSITIDLPAATEQNVRAVLSTLAETYHGRGSVELGDPYKVLVATIISQRTREEQTTSVSERVFARYPNVTTLAAADVTELQMLLEGCQYPEIKAPRLIALARTLLVRYDGRVPGNRDALLELPGVGRKTANCVLIYAFHQEALCVDIHMQCKVSAPRTSGRNRTSAPLRCGTTLSMIVPRMSRLVAAGISGDESTVCTSRSACRL
jgi:endonuclease-3